MNQHLHNNQLEEWKVLAAVQLPPSSFFHVWHSGTSLSSPAGASRYFPALCILPWHLRTAVPSPSLLPTDAAPRHSNSVLMMATLVLISLFCSTSTLWSAQRYLHSDGLLPFRTPHPLPLQGTPTPDSPVLQQHPPPSWYLPVVKPVGPPQCPSFHHYLPLFSLPWLTSCFCLLIIKPALQMIT